MLITMKYKENLIKYFEVFSNKDIDTLSKMFSDNVQLKDWNIFASGKEEVVTANKGIFDSVNSIKVTPVNFYSNSDTSYAVQISILINGEEELNVIDVIELDNTGLIQSVSAFILGE